MCGAGGLSFIIKFTCGNDALTEARGRLCVSPRCLYLSLSGNHLEDEGCRLVTEAASQLRIAQKLE